MEIGKQIKRLRTKTNLTQEELAHRCELSKGFISQIERDLASPSIATLVDILEALGTNLKDFFAESVDEKIVFKREDISTSEYANQGCVIQWIIPNAQKNAMEPIILELLPKGISDKMKPYQGEVFGYVLEGSVFVTACGGRHRAKKGEGFYYKANAEHYIENASKNKASVLWVSAPPNF